MERALVGLALCFSVGAVVWSGVIWSRLREAEMHGGRRAANIAADECDIDNSSTLTTCLLPSSDGRHDESRRLKDGVDCFWEDQASNKYLHAYANGFSHAFFLAVSNHCSVDVDVTLIMENGTLGFRDADCGFENAAGEIDLGTVMAGGGPKHRVCWTKEYAADPNLPSLERPFKIRAVKIGAQPIQVDADPEIVLDRSGTTGEPPLRTAPPPAPPPPLR